MSGPEEVERLIAIVAGGIRAKMMRPKCLARDSWTGDSTVSLLRRIHEESEELRAEVSHLRRDWDAFGESPSLLSSISRVFSETSDVAAFGAMLADSRRLVRLRLLPSRPAMLPPYEKWDAATKTLHVRTPSPGEWPLCPTCGHPRE